MKLVQHLVQKLIFYADEFEWSHSSQTNWQLESQVERPRDRPTDMVIYWAPGHKVFPLVLQDAISLHCFVPQLVVTKCWHKLYYMLVVWKPIHRGFSFNKIWWLLQNEFCIQRIFSFIWKLWNQPTKLYSSKSNSE